MKRSTTLVKRCRRLWAAAFWLIVWQVAAMAVGQRLLLASPVETLLRLLQLIRTAVFWQSALFSMGHILLGFGLAVALSITFSALAARFTAVRELLSPPLAVIRSVPVASFVIVALIWIPSRRLSVLISFLIALPVLYEGVLAAISRTDPQLLEMAHVFRMSPVNRLIHLYLPAVLPHFRAAVAPLKGAGFENLFVSRHEGKTRATMKIQEGCDRYCSYCIIPYVRGPVRSMPMDAVRAEAKRLAEAGYREIVVTGIHLASYGRGTEFQLIDAIRAVHDTPGVERVRLGSLEPITADDEFARALSEMPGIARQFHLSMQSGSAGVLRRMHRRYTPEEYFAACENLRRYMPDCAITTDVIAGFPGETEEEFAETMAFVERVKFARIHVFPYSRRSGTVADRMENQVPENIRHERAQKLIGLGNKLEAEYVSNMVGSERLVLFEQPVGETLAEGYTGEYVRVRAAGTPNDFGRVRIVRAEGTLAIGEPVTEDGR